MISQQQLEDRIFDYFNIIFGNNGVAFGMPADENQRYLVDRQTNAPRVSDGTVLYYRVESKKPMGRSRGSSRNRLDRNTNIETVELWNEVHVIVNILSANKGSSKDATNFFIASVNSERDYQASTSTVLPFELLLHRMSNDIRNLSALETDAWQERQEFDLYFNYKDEIELDNIQWLQQPATAPEVRDIIEWETKLKQKGN